jgi:hypothetical protein
VAALIGTGRADAVEMLQYSEYRLIEYYRYLNGGYRLPLVGGTDKMSAQVPVGLYRTYVKLFDEDLFTYGNWCKALRAGRTILSGGPLLDLTVNNALIGDTLRLPSDGGKITVTATARGIFPVGILQIIQEGVVIAESDGTDDPEHLEAQLHTEIVTDTWFAARCVPDTDVNLRHRDEWERSVFAHTSPIYVTLNESWQLFSASTAEYMLTLIDGGVEHVHKNAALHVSDAVTHHHGEKDHVSYLLRPFEEARAAILDRARSNSYPDIAQNEHGLR